jgi:hypothetical protein
VSNSAENKVPPFGYAAQAGLMVSAGLFEFSAPSDFKYLIVAISAGLVSLLFRSTKSAVSIVPMWLGSYLAGRISDQNVTLLLLLIVVTGIISYYVYRADAQSQ